jgi:hypothetical protein
MIIINPAGEETRPQLALAPRLTSLGGKRIAIIDNTKHMAEVFLRELERVLQEDYGVREFEYYRKPHASVPIPNEVMQRLLGSCDAFIHGVAD